MVKDALDHHPAMNQHFVQQGETEPRLGLFYSVTLFSGIIQTFGPIAGS